MGKGGKARPAPWRGVLRGTLAAIALYLNGTALLALLIVKGAVPEGVMFPMTAVLCVLSTLCGGLLAGRHLDGARGSLAGVCAGGRAADRDTDGQLQEPAAEAEMTPCEILQILKKPPQKAAAFFEFGFCAAKGKDRADIARRMTSFPQMWDCG